MSEAEKQPGVWETPQKILVVLAHPDDPEFFCGATLARWAAAGHQISYCLLTCGDKGTKDRALPPDNLCRIRQVEQRAAADVLGVKDITILGYPDGYLVPTLDLRREITRLIRRARPDIFVTCDPSTFYSGDWYVNHPDHRAAGQIALEAVFPSAGNHLYFPELLLDEGLEPHSVREVWISLTTQPNVTLDATDFWETKIRALLEHKSQIGDPQKLIERIRSRRTPESTPENPRYAEYFRRQVIG